MGCDQTSDRPVVYVWKTSNVVCLWIYAVNWQGHISQEDSQMSEKPQKFALEHFAYMVYTAITLLAIYSYSYTASYS